MKTEKLNPFGALLEASPGTPACHSLREQAISLVREHKLVLIRGLNALSREELLRFTAEDPAELLHWEFGPVMEMQVDPYAANYLFSREDVPVHWDGAFHLEPRILVFHCVEAPTAGSGGETTFVDSEKLWNDANAATRAHWKKLELSYETEKKAHYGGRITVPMVQIHPHKPVTILRYAEPVRSELNPVLMEVNGLHGTKEDFLEEMRALLYAPENIYVHEWRTNDLLLADNFSLLHGRRAFAAASPRHLRRIQIR